ncbi:unnamed protein product [Arctogadus glacialis]
MLWTDCVWFCDVPPSSTTDSPSPWREGRENLLDELDELTLQGWMLHDKSLYRVSTTKKGWRASREDCQKIKADLVVINSREELDPEASAPAGGVGRRPAARLRRGPAGGGRVHPGPQTQALLLRRGQRGGDGVGAIQLEYTAARLPVVRRDRCPAHRGARHHNAHR